MHSFQPLRRVLLAALAGAGLLAGLPGAQAADAWPTKPIPLIVPFAPGCTSR